MARYNIQIQCVDVLKPDVILLFEHVLELRDERHMRRRSFDQILDSLPTGTWRLNYSASIRPTKINDIQ